MKSIPTPLFAPQRRQLLAYGATALASACAGMSLPAAAQGAYPNRSVKLYVGASSGGVPDVTGRALSRILGDIWGQPIVVDNRPGVSGLLAAELTSQAPGDGYTLGLLLDTVITTVPFMADKLSMDPLTDLRPIALLGGFPLILVANPNVKYRTLQELMAQAKANPGKIDYASSGLGSSGHLAMELLTRSAGVSMTHVPYKGGIPALQDVVAGQVPMIWGSLGACAPLMQAGKVIALAIGSPERFSLQPSVPTAAEQGFPGFTAGAWMGIFGPLKTPDALVRKIHDDLARLAQNPAYREALLAQGIEPRTISTEEFGKLVRSEYDRNKALFASLGLGPKK